MENASKALYIAGGILISIFVVSIAVYIFHRGALLSYEFDSKLSDEELQAYNDEILKYAAKDYILAQDVISIVNKAYDINETNKKNGGKDFINIIIKDEKSSPKKTYEYNEDSEEGCLSDDITWIDFLNKYSNTSVENNKTVKYEDKFKVLDDEIRYHDNGKIKKVTISKL